MTFKDKETIQRMLGTIEGIAFCVENKYSEPLFNAAQIIQEIISQEKGSEKQ
jgi:hypothetical protein